MDIAHQILLWLKDNRGLPNETRRIAVKNALRGTNFEELWNYATAGLLAMDMLLEHAHKFGVMIPEAWRFAKNAADGIQRGRRSKVASEAAKKRHEKERKRLDGKREKLRELWASGRYQTHAHCAKTNAVKLGLKESTALRALRNL